MARVDLATVMRIVADRLQTASGAGVTVLQMSVPPAQGLTAWARMASLRLDTQGRIAESTDDDADEQAMRFTIECGCELTEQGSQLAIATVAENVASVFDGWGTSNADHDVMVFRAVSREVSADPDETRLLQRGQIEFAGKVVRNTGSTRETYNPQS